MTRTTAALVMWAFTTACTAQPTPPPDGQPDPTAAAETAQQPSTATPPFDPPTAQAAASPTAVPGEQDMPLQLTSPAFAPGEPIPARYSCDGEDRSPALAWNEGPPGTRSFALIFDDPDAPGGTWVHWVLFNLPASARGLPEGVSDAAELPDGGRHGTNSWGRAGYGGPCPPGGTHRYFFKLYALDQLLDLPAMASKADLEAAMQQHVLEQSELMGTYSR